MCHESEVVIHIYPFTHWFHRNLVTNSVSCDILAKLHATYDFCPAMGILSMVYSTKGPNIMENCLCEYQ